MVNKFINKDKVEDTYTGFLDKKTGNMAVCLKLFLIIIHMYI